MSAAPNHTRAEQPERNAHVHPLLRGVLNAFADTAFDAARSAELQAERLEEWRADDRESAQIERGEREA